MKSVIYPGTFDPITNGHIDLVERASYLFDKVYVAIASSTRKNPMFSLEERVEMTTTALTHLENVEVLGFDRLLVHLASELDAVAILRGLRAVSDFEYEFQMAQMNRHLDSSLETIFLMPSQKYFFTSSQLIKQVHRYGERETGLVPENVRLALKKKSVLERNNKELEQ